MKKYILCLIIFLISGWSAAQQYHPLTLQEVEKRLLPQFGPMVNTPIQDITLEEIKKQRKIDSEMPWPELKNKDSIEVVHSKIPGFTTKDPEIPVTIYKPKNAKNLPIFLWFHGGGFIYGTPKWDHQKCADYAQKGNIVVINVDYRFAPENPFPAALHDAYASLLWANKNAENIGGNPKLLAVGGASAGAGISGGLAQYARDQKGPKISLQVLEIPPGDFEMKYPSVIELKRIPGLKSDDFPIIKKFYIGKNGNSKEKYILPGNIEDVSNLPPTVIFVAGADPLRDSGLAYADRLIKAGNFTELHFFAGYAHGMPLPGSTEITLRAMKQFLK
ncbi:alpha/beta hydrolase [Chryseobacterium antibioticum]|uniref:Alpha/beta hydrolase n=1 Tax=Chryseobacterium pyrolae TaxID=2987481 RepID=A0ABT2ILP2_9FLAO|nr:alpha/beta hydrolase [Chryseobacterium pyrolae]MCT2409147.1 alpha/beta hydrolase [Chryseobacterium pyrolae]